MNKRVLTTFVTTAVSVLLGAAMTSTAIAGTGEMPTAQEQQAWAADILLRNNRMAEVAAAACTADMSCLGESLMKVSEQTKSRNAAKLAAQAKTLAQE